jgi:hypothetical protein
MFGLSKREMEKKFRRSELVTLAWRSQEVSVSFETKEGKPQKKRKYSNAQVPQNLPDHFYNEDGEIDLRQVTGPEAYKFMMMQGVKLPVIGRG